MQNHENRWTIFREPVATWVADLSSVQLHPNSLLDWIAVVLEAGDSSSCGRVISVSSASHSSSRAEAERFCRSTYERTGKLDLLNFLWPTMHSQYRLEALVEHYDKSGTIVQSCTTDLSRTLRDANPDTLVNPPDIYAPPIEVYGMVIDYSRGQPVPNYAMVSFSLTSDIWFRTIIDHRKADSLNQTVTNLEIHQHNVQRINRYIQVVKQYTLQLGGTWSLDSDNQYRLPVYEQQLSSNGIVTTL